MHYILIRANNRTGNPYNEIKSGIFQEAVGYIRELATQTIDYTGIPGNGWTVILNWQLVFQEVIAYIRDHKRTGSPKN